MGGPIHLLAHTVTFIICISIIKKRTNHFTLEEKEKSDEIAQKTGSDRPPLQSQSEEI